MDSIQILILLLQMRTCSLPQETILGPLLFLIYINDLPNCLSFSIPRMYADDTHITYAGSDLHLIQSSLSHDLEKLSKWLVCNRLTLNATKTEFMVIGSRQRLSTLSDTLELSIDNVPIEQVSSVKSLGIYIDENLTWHFHIDKLCKKIASATGPGPWTRSDGLLTRSMDTEDLVHFYPQYFHSNCNSIGEIPLSPPLIILYRA